MRLYFIGGGDIKDNELIKIDKVVLSKAGKHPRMVILPWTTTDPQRIEAYKVFMSNYFSKLGAKRVYYASISDSKEEIKEKINHSDLIYLPGGDTECLIRTIKQKGLGPILRKYKGIIAGNSAGALALCKESVLTKEYENPPKPKIIDGLGLVDFSVEVHYQKLKDARLLELSKKRRIYAIPEKCAISWYGKRLSPIGPVYLFYKGKKSRV